MAEEWRRVVATLADPTRRLVYASLILGGEIDIPRKNREKALAVLEAAGLIDSSGAVVGDIYRELLAQEPAITRTGIDRFIRDGRIEQYPSKPSDRLELLEWAARKGLTQGETITEREFNERLEQITTDFASLRRYLVDAGLVKRDAAGATYELNQDA